MEERLAQAPFVTMSHGICEPKNLGRAITLEDNGEANRYANRNTHAGFRADRTVLHELGYGNCFGKRSNSRIFPAT